jgi:hypothetical protein
MTLPATESMRSRSSFHSVIAAAHRVCDRYGLPQPSLSPQEFWFAFFSACNVKGERWLFV